MILIKDRLEQTVYNKPLYSGLSLQFYQITKQHYILKRKE